MAFAGSAGVISDVGEMAGCFPGKVRRKDLDDEFSEFSLSSPARKIRRLDGELPPILEEEDPATRQLAPRGGQGEGNTQQQLAPPTGLNDAEPPVPPLNEETALVLYKPVRSPLLESPYTPNVCFRLDSDLVAGFKSQAFWSGGQGDLDKLGEKRLEASDSSKSCLEIVPWVSSRLMEEEQEPMESDEQVAEVASSMDVEEEGAVSAGIMEEEGIEGSQQQWWQQQHCMIPPPTQLPRNPSTTSVVWFR